MDYCNTAKINLYLLIVLCLISCRFESQNKQTDVDKFYLPQRMGQQMNLLPLAKPMKLTYDNDMHNWFMDVNNNPSRVQIHNPTTIGVNSQYVYGKVESSEKVLNKVEEGDNVYAYYFGGATWTPKSLEGKEHLRIFPIKGRPNTYILPERWYIINASEGKGEGFFNYDEYLKSLNEKGIEEKIYKSDSLLKEFQNTGVLEYFPDSIKTKLKH